MLNLEQTKGLKTTTSVNTNLDKTNRLRWLIPAFAIAAVLELLLWRTFSRVGVFIPKGDTFEQIYRVIAQIGVITLNFAVILGVASLVMTLNRLRVLGSFGTAERREWPLSVAFVAIVLVAGLTLTQMGLVQNLLVTLFLRLALLTAFGALAVDYWQRHSDWRKRLFVTGLFGATAAQILARLLHDELVLLFNFHGMDNLYLPMLLGGELLVLLNGFGTFLAYGSAKESPLRGMLQSWKALAGAIAIGVVFLVTTLFTSNVAQSAIVPILGLYALGYTMQLPFPLYLAALFFFLYTVFYNLGRLKLGAEQKAAAFGLLLIFTGGYVFNLSNQYIFALVGLLLLARPELLEE